MAAFILPESAENDLYQAGRLAALMESAFAALGEAQAEVRGDELAADFGLLREKLDSARSACRFSGKAG